MVLVTPVSSIIFLILVLVVTLFITYQTPAENFDGSKTYVFLTVLAGVGVFITFLFYYGVVELNAQEQALATVQETARTDELNNKMITTIAEASAAVPGFVASITPLQNNGRSYYDEVNPVNENTKLAVAYTIFSVWQDMFIADKFTGNEPVAYVSNFLQRANSTQLYDQWKLAYIDFNRSTQILGELLFEYALPITRQHPEVYQEAAQRFVKDPRYKEVYDLR